MLIMLYDISCINYLLLNRFQFFPNKFDLMGLLGLTLMRLLNISNNYLLGAQQSCNLSTLSDSINDSLSSIKSTSIRKWIAVSSPKPQDPCHQQFNCFFPYLNQRQMFNELLCRMIRFIPRNQSLKRTNEAVREVIDIESLMNDIK